MRIYTIGHSNKDILDFLWELKKKKVDILIDVRSKPQSRRNIQFNQDSIERISQAQGIMYVWLGESLGGFREEGFERYMETPAFHEGIKELISRAVWPNNAAIMCAEADWKKCHRRFIAKKLAPYGFSVVHL